MTEHYSEHYFSSFDGLSLYYRVYSPVSKKRQKPDLICLSGLSRNSYDFQKFATIMQKKGHRVISLDYRGRGESQYDPNPDNYHIGTYAEDLRHLLVVTNVHRFVLVGSSLGGRIAMLMGGAMPRVLEAVVLNDIGPEVRHTWVESLVEKMEQNQSFSTWEKAVDHVKTSMKWLDSLSEEQLLERTRWYFREDTHGRIARKWDINALKALKTRKSYDSWDQFVSLANIPTLLVRGGDSELLSRELFEDMEKTLKQKQNNGKPTIFRVEIPNRGHVPDLDEPQFLKAFDSLIEVL